MLIKPGFITFFAFLLSLYFSTILTAQENKQINHFFHNDEIGEHNCRNPDRISSIHGINMQEIFPFENMLVLSSLAVFLLLGVILRAKLPCLQRFLIPSCLIGGFIVMILRNIFLQDILPYATLEIMVYHLFNLSFISVGLTPAKESGDTQRFKIDGALGMGLIQGVIFPLQAIIGGLLTLLFIYAGFNIFSTLI